MIAVGAVGEGIGGRGVLSGGGEVVGAEEGGLVGAAVGLIG